MLLSEAEAATRRCPNHSYMGEPQGFCLGSGCMAWRWGGALEFTTAPNPPGTGWQVAPPDSGFRWRRKQTDNGRGFCGLAGDPISEL